MNKEKIAKLPQSIYLNKEFRTKLFSKAYDKSGSLRGIAIDMGYPGRPGLNGVARDMWLGKRSIGKHKVEYLLKLTGISLEEFTANIITKDKSVETENWTQAYTDYKLKEEQKNRK